MKKITLALIITTLLFCNSTTAQNKVTKIDGVEYLYDLIVIRDNNKIGLKDNNNKVLIEPHYQKIEFDSISEIYRAYINKKEYEIYGMYSGKQKFNALLLADEFLDKESDGLLKIKTSKGYGIVGLENSFLPYNETPGFVVPPVFKHIESDHEHLNPYRNIFVVKTHTNKLGIYNYDGDNQTIIDTVYDEIKLLNEKYNEYNSPLLVSKDKKLGLFKPNDRGYEIMLEPIFDEIIDIVDQEYFRGIQLRINNKVGIIKNDMDTLIPFIYDKIDWAKKEIRQSDEIFFIPSILNKKKGKIILHPYSFKSFFVEKIINIDNETRDYAVVQNDKKLALLSFVDFNLSSYLDVDKLEILHGDYIITTKAKTLNLYLIIDLLKESNPLPIKTGLKNIDEVNSWIDNN